MKPVEINKGILQIIDKISDKLSWTELDYYKLRLIREQSRLYSYMFNPICPQEYQKDIKDMIDKLQGYIDTIENYLSDKQLSNCTHRLSLIRL